MSSASTTTDRWLSWQLRHSGGAPVPLFHQALRTRSEAALDALVTMATDGVHSSDTLLARVVDGDGVPGLSAPDLARQQALAGVAFTWAGRQRDPREIVGAAAIFANLWGTGAMATYGHQLKLTSLQTLFLAGRYQELTRLLPHADGLHPDAEHYLRTDLAHPRVCPDGDEDTWSTLLSARFVESSLAPVELLDVGRGPGQAPFDRLAAPSAAPGSAGGKGLVTVVMPCWRPDEGLITSVRSISNQTYPDLEIILVDDCSGPDHAHLFAEAAAYDSRVRVLTMPRNGGSYLCRSAAIAASTGTYITFQDADDWSHPSRIELQVAALEAAPEAPMSRSRAVRAKDDLTHQWLGYRAIRDNASSLLIRREVLGRTGGFLPVRKGADSEFAERVALLEGAVADVPAPLAITRLRSGSLSRSDFTFSWMAPDRYRFRAAFTAWHRRLRQEAQEGRTVRVSDEELATPPFPVPPSWVRDLDAAARTPTSFATAYLGAFSHQLPTPGSRWLLDRLTSAPQDEPVGLWHQEARVTSSAIRPHLAHDWDDLLLDGVVHPISRLDPSTVHRLVVLDPAVVTLHRDQPVLVEVEHVDVWLTPELVEPGRCALPEDLLEISDAIHQHWGSRPRWLLAPWLTPLECAHVRDALPGLPVGEARP
ncbi:hypothetical protein BJF80_00150 [Serinicoccus sp. CUA-874]|uniref:glycosyltransferase family 2 protein n=1 Tax=Serinicoccus sp. CUA-874 TaxID=1517939 RepID=UPI0009656B41|nr:glycosyltransferase family 2 protein [Serinicoccus sp. CUA-874]OLT17789.1 hypothetical protein BJF80_00150 [Serinicoccus sp. CUA-874]